MIHYHITPNPQTHIYHIKLTFIPTQSCHELRLPVWIPGSYMVREFSKNIINLFACQNSKDLPVLQLEKNIWQLEELVIGNIVSIEYQVYAYEFGIRTAHLESSRAYFNPSSLCLYITGCESIEHRIQLNGLPTNWLVATGLTKGKNKHEFLAANYDELIDCPIEMGKLTILDFMVKNTSHKLVLSGVVLKNFDRIRLINDIKKICEVQIDLFGGIAPFNEYYFLLHLGGEIFTGLEHRNSTLLMAKYTSLPLQNAKSDSYLQLLQLISHEYFHSWNVKRIKPQVFNPYCLDRENYTKLLWWFEGITSYYDDLMVYRAGLIDQIEYLKLILDNINNVYKFAGVKQQSLANASLTAWVKYYRQDENSPNSIVNYYVKGALVGICLDLLIRKKSDGKNSLDTVMLGLFNKWQRDGLGIGENDLPDLIKEYTGIDLSAELDLFINTTKMLPLNELFNLFGLQLFSTRGKFSDSGQVSYETESDPVCDQFDLGAKLVKESSGYRITHVYMDGMAQMAGLAANDLIIAINDLKLNNLDESLTLYRVDDELNLTFFRGERLLKSQLKLTSPSANIYHLHMNNKQDLEKWL